MKSTLMMLDDQMNFMLLETFCKLDILHCVASKFGLFY